MQVAVIKAIPNKDNVGYNITVTLECSTYTGRFHSTTEARIYLDSRGYTQESKVKKPGYILECG